MTLTIRGHLLPQDRQRKPLKLPQLFLRGTDRLPHILLRSPLLLLIPPNLPLEMAEVATYRPDCSEVDHQDGEKSEGRGPGRCPANWRCCPHRPVLVVPVMFPWRRRQVEALDRIWIFREREERDWCCSATYMSCMNTTARKYRPAALCKPPPPPPPPAAAAGQEPPGSSSESCRTYMRRILPDHHHLKHDLLRTESRTTHYTNATDLR
mmetsp:Transcript_14595/g.31437  ORF Transcript_14595/g.31437 Transcript_14595/m.31437 type:complete len:209 (+) Transcript_14595:493-1119(+)